jgi:acyl-CoA thioester hydrolase
VNHPKKRERIKDFETVDMSVRVRYADTDKMGVVYHGTYSVYFEVGRSEYIRKKGFTYRDFEEMGYQLVVVELEAKYYGSGTYDDLLTVKTGISDLKSRGLTFHYEIYKNGNIIVEGKTKHICLNADRKPALIPSPLVEILKDVKPQ